MAWTWKGFWGDDPVYRFNCGQDFFQAGRSKAEERFWVNYIHDDGSFLRPLRSRMTSRASSVVTSASGRPRTRNISTQSDSSWSSGTVSGRTRNSSSGSISDQVPNYKLWMHFISWKINCHQIMKCWMLLNWWLKVFHLMKWIIYLHRNIFTLFR